MSATRDRRGLPESIAGAPWLRDPVLQQVLGVLNRGGVARVVGGAVRNTLMGRDVTDIDIATTQLPEQVSSLAQGAGFQVVPTGVDHGTVTIVAGGAHRHFETTTLRRDVETHGRHATVVFTDDWASDAARRDFTINAVYCDADGTLHDPVGGIADIVAGRVQFVGDARARIREDYLRILRFFRFSAQYAADGLDEAGLAACVAEQAGLVRLSAERVRNELLKLLVAPGAARVIAAMSDNDILQRLFGAHTATDVALRLFALERACGLPADAIRRIGALGSSGGIDSDDLKARFRLANADARRLEHLQKAPTDLGPRLTEHDRRAALYRLGPETYVDAVLLAWAHASGSVDEVAWRDLLSLPERWGPPELPVAGRDLVALGVAPGPEVGRLLADIEERWIESDFTLGREALLALATRQRGA